VPVEGEWDVRVGRRGAGGKIGNSTGITLACTSGAIGKCVSRMHYKPWTGAWTPRYGNGAHWGWQWYGWGYSDSGEYEEWAREGDLAHRACVRMVRADYCADGHDHTMEGTEIDVGDSFSPSINQLGARPWQLEAYWGPDGALCMNEPRWATLVHAGACVCDYSGGVSCVRGDQIGAPGVDYVPFTQGCEPIEGTIFNRSSTLPADSDWVPW